MTISLQCTSVTVTNTEESLTFYRDALGLSLAISKPYAGRCQADGNALAERLIKGVLPMLVFTTDDLDAAYESAVAAGAEVLQEPIEQPWGPRDCAFRDPSGNMVRVLQS